MTLANKITITRIVSVPLFIIIFIYTQVYSHYKEYSMYVFVLFNLIALTDGLDGFIARYYKQKSVLGSLLDPLADKFLIVSSYFLFLYFSLIPLWISLIIILRDVLLLFGYVLLIITKKNIDIKPIFVSKLTTFFQFLTVASVLFANSFVNQYPLTDFYLTIKLISYITVILTMISFWQYLVIGVRRMEAD